MMKKLVLAMAVSALSVFGTAMAKEAVKCPDAGVIRDVGTKLIRGFQETQVNDFLWQFYSEPYFLADGGMWQTIFEENIPQITNPSTALHQAQDDLNTLPISTYSTSYVTGDGVTVCDYVPYQTNYKIIAVNHVDVARKSLR